MSTNATGQRAGESWRLLADRHFQDFDEFSQVIRGWDLDFRQIQAGSSPAELLQFGSPQFLVTRFRMSRAYDQRGGTPPNTLTFSILDEDVLDTTTPEGPITEDGIWCFPVSREFAAASGANFRGCTLSLSESLLDEVAERCELSGARRLLGTGKIVRCRRNDIDAIRHRLGRICAQMRRDDAGRLDPRQKHDLEFDLSRQLLEALAGKCEFVRPRMTSRRRLVLRRALDYVEANRKSPITVTELAHAAGAGIRTLEYVFKDYFGVTPKAYLGAQRLVGVHRELRRADAIHARVRVAAHQWGFWHMGQFARDYQRFFGKLPSKTLPRK